MFLNPKDIKELLINGEKSLSSIVDITAEQLFKIDNAFSYISNNSAVKQEQGKHLVELSDSLEANERYGLHRKTTRHEDHGWFLEYQQTYLVDSGVSISVPTEVTVLLVSNPELNDNAVNVLQKTFPAGYTGNITFALHNINGNTFLEKGTKVAQLFFISSPKVEIVIPATTTTTEAPVVEPVVEPVVIEEAPIAIVELPVETTTTEVPVVATEEVSAPRRNRPR
jgi:deoxycytidine triphosphate deaminase